MSIAHPHAAASAPARSNTLPGFASVGGPTTSAWREEALTRAAELDGLAAWIEHERADIDDIGDRVETVRRHIRSAREAAAGAPLENGARPGLWGRMQSLSSGSSVERAQGNLDSAEADLLRLAPVYYLCGLMPGLEAHVNRNLPKDDPRRIRVVQLARKSETKELNERERSTIVSAVHAANSQRRRDVIRVRSFRNIILAAAMLLLLVAIGLGALGSVHPGLAPLCFTPDDTSVVCPTHQTTIMAGESPDAAMRATASGWDIWLVELIGIVAATVATAFALRKIRGTSTPYSLPVALAMLKLPTGALTAFLGILLMRGGFVPGLSALDTSAQILSWAIVFGYSQQLFTRFVDDQAQSVLADIGGRGASGDRAPTAKPA
jgi:hypothetical protein